MSDMNYIAKCKGCGRVVGVISGECSKKEQAKEVGAWIRDGLSIDQLSTEKVREADWVCQCRKEKKESAQPALL